jgi:hypothetical protein
MVYIRITSHAISNYQKRILKKGKKRELKRKTHDEVRDKIYNDVKGVMERRHEEEKYGNFKMSKGLILYCTFIRKEECVVATVYENNNQFNVRKFLDQQKEED